MGEVQGWLIQCREAASRTQVLSIFLLYHPEGVSICSQVSPQVTGWLQQPQASHTHLHMLTFKSTMTVFLPCVPVKEQEKASELPPVDFPSGCTAVKCFTCLLNHQ